MFRLSCWACILSLPLNVYAADFNAKLSNNVKFNNFKLSASAEQRYSADKLNYHYYDTGISTPIAHNWHVALKYRYVSKLKDESWQLEQRPYLQLNTKLLQRDTYILKLQARQEWRFHTEQDTQYRSRLKLSATGADIFNDFMPFVSHEVLYDWNESQYNCNMLQIGVAIDNFPWGKLSIAYKYTSKLKEYSWQGADAIVIQLKG